MQDYPENSSKSKPDSRRASLPTKVKIKPIWARDAWGYIVRTLEGELVATDFGALPAGFNFSQQTSELFSLAQAARKMRECPTLRVVSVCSRLPLEGNGERGKAA